VLWDGGATAVADSLRIDTVWQIETPPPYEITLFVHVLNAQGELVAQADGQPWARTFPMGQWPPDAVVGDTRVIPLPPNAGQLAIGLYNSLTGERLAVTTAQSGPTDQILLDITNSAPGD
jgi:hypothetical protein